MASFFPTSILQTKHPTTQTTLGRQCYPLLCVRKSAGDFYFQYNRYLYYNYKFPVKWRINVIPKASDKLQSMLRNPLSIVYDTSSERRSQFFEVSEAQNSTKRTLRVFVAPFEHIISKLNSGIPVNFAVGFGMVVVFMVIAVKGYMSRQSGDGARGSVADLIKRGQLRSDQRAISRPLNYDDPFNNPMVRTGKKNSTVKMCGKVFRLAPVSLTEEKVLSHQNRRIRAYQWKRPTVFLKEGDPIPEGVDPETIRWIPANHPFATATNDIDEDFAQKNIYQKRGAPFRLREEHEALQRKMMEATHNKSVQDDNGQAKKT